tara:strand:- start:1468 stop:2670 length:1203 start_codon:yes stop_codon:yes gene_type:complete
MDDNDVPYVSMELASNMICVLAVISLCLWLGVAYRLWVIARTKPTVREGLSLFEPENTSVSVIIPVHNEERVIHLCASSLRNQSFKELQIIFVLDRCNDGTLEILKKHAKEDNRICIIENDSCPEGWAGKCNAAKIGASKATGKWMLFTDADTIFDKELIKCAVASAIKRKAALLSLLSTLTITKNFERIIQPIASTFLVRQFPVDRINREQRSRPFANGQFLLFTNEMYTSIGGHDAVKEELLEDIAFARIVHQAGERVQVLFADGLLQCSMYSTFEAFKQGWKRIYIEASSRNVNRLFRSGFLVLIVSLFLPAVSIAGVVIGNANSPTLLWTSVASLVATAFVIGWIYFINNAPIIFAIFAPIGGLVVAKLFFDSASILKNGTPISWGGREYILEPKT